VKWKEYISSIALRKMFSVAESVENLMSETHELGGSAVVVDRATPKASLYSFSFYGRIICEIREWCSMCNEDIFKNKIKLYQRGFISICFHCLDLTIEGYLFFIFFCIIIWLYHFYRKMTLSQLAECHRGEDMVHTMHIFLQQLDMQLSELLLCMTIPAQFMEVSMEALASVQLK
jgi:hypothetical protein